MKDFNVEVSREGYFIFNYKNIYFKSVYLVDLTDEQINYISNFVLMTLSFQHIKNANPNELTKLFSSNRGMVFVYSFCMFFMESKSTLKDILNAIKNDEKEYKEVLFSIFTNLVTGISIAEDNNKRIQDNIEKMIETASNNIKSEQFLLCATPLNKESI